MCPPSPGRFVHCVFFPREEVKDFLDTEHLLPQRTTCSSLQVLLTPQLRLGQMDPTFNFLFLVTTKPPEKYQELYCKQRSHIFWAYLGFCGATLLRICLCWLPKHTSSCHAAHTGLRASQGRASMRRCSVALAPEGGQLGTTAG